ncbi:low specificity L-threonine aldolase [Streptomyces sp. NPDC005811]|uniref:threonine aldolase family protein n=1 Tax=Streptomyces sp. NPDC005811 TaxID=3154565 RepID=UPI0033C94201
MTTPARIFSSDNAAGASPEIVEAVTRAAAGQARPYGADDLTVGVRRRLGEIFEREVDVLLVSSGTAANALSLAALTPPWGSVLCHRDSHINNDECGAPEFYTAGAKLVPLGGEDAKIDPEELRAAVRHKAGDVHSVEPSVVSLTQATETGAVYTLDEIGTLGSLAREAGLRLHMDGARFAGAVAALGRTPAELTWRTGVDLLSFGATKNGTMTADAIVVFDRSLTPELSFRAKRAGQLASKMRFHAAQLDAYLTDGLWLRNAAHANTMAARLQDGLKALPEVDLLGVADANIVFCRLPRQITEGLLGEGYVFYHDRWEPGVTRFVTSFATTRADVDGLLEAVRRYAG